MSGKLRLRVIERVINGLKPASVAVAVAVMVVRVDAERTAAQVENQSETKRGDRQKRGDTDDGIFLIDKWRLSPIRSLGIIATTRIDSRAYWMRNRALAIQR